MGKMITIALITAGSFIAGILLAPKSGKETRRDLLDKTNEYKERLNAGVEEFKKGADAARDELRYTADSMKDIAKDTAAATRRATR
jgi:gas vesicle protein